MISENDIKVGMALLAEVAQKMHAELGALAAVAAGVEYDAKIDTLCDELLRQCSTAEKKLGEYRPGLAYAAFLGGRLLAVQAKPGGTISTRGKAIQSYERAIELGHDEALTRYYLGLLHSANYKVVGGHKDKAIENLQRVVDMKGIDSELGMESAKEIEKLTAKKSGCFIATAAYGSPQAEQVGVLCEFRDRVLSLSLLGRCFIRFYYWASPPIASYVGSRDRLRRAARNILVGPALKLARRCLRVIEAVPSNAERR
jgi:TPR repeat protein